MVIIPGIHAINLGFVNCYLIEEPDSLTLIDCGIPPSGKKIASYINSIGRPIKELKNILITHSDGDHIGSLADLKELSGAKVYSSAIEAEGIKLGKSTRKIEFKGFMKIAGWLMSKRMKVKPADVDKFLKENDEIPVLGGLLVLETAGHTPGHLSFYLKSTKVLFSGDSFLVKNDKLYTASTSLRQMFTWNKEKSGESIMKQTLLKPGIVCPGHGGVVKNAEKFFD